MASHVLGQLDSRVYRSVRNNTDRGIVYWTEVRDVSGNALKTILQTPDSLEIAYFKKGDD